MAAEDIDSAAAKLTAIAAAELARGRNDAAVAAADEALTHAQNVRTRFLAARTYAEAGKVEKARPLVEGLDNEVYEEARAYAKIVQGVLALKRGDAGRAVISLREANQLFDSWIGQFDLGRALLEAGLFAQADSAFDACLNARRGEALALFVDEQPTYAYIAPVHHYLGRTRQELKSTRFREAYQEYLEPARELEGRPAAARSPQAGGCRPGQARRGARAGAPAGGLSPPGYLLLSCAVTDTVGPTPTLPCPVGGADPSGCTSVRPCRCRGVRP